MRNVLFSGSAQTANLGRRTARGGVAAFSAELVNAVVRMGSLFVLARILDVEDFGVVAMATALVYVAERFKDMGLADATVQAPSVNHETTSGLFWLNSAIAVLIGLLIAAASPLVVAFYQDSRLLGVTIGVSGAFAIGGFTIQHQALLRRHLRFGALGAIQVTAAVGSQGVAILAAYLGAGYWSLVYRELARAVLVVIGTAVAMPWRPGRPRGGASVRAHLSFGRDLTGFNLIVFLSRSLDRVLLGRLHGASSVGVYSNAYITLTQPVSQIQYPVRSVALPALSALQNDPPKFNRYFERMVGLVIFMTMPISVFVALFADGVVLFLLGPNWMGAVPIIRVLAVGAFAEPIGQMIGPALVASGKSKAYFRLGVFVSSLMAVGVAVGSPWGVLGVAWGHSLAVILGVGVGFVYGLPHTPAKLPSLLRIVGRTAAITLTSGGLTALLRLAAGWEMPALRLLLVAVGGACIHVAVWLVLPKNRVLLLQYVGYAVRLLGRDRGLRQE